MAGGHQRCHLPQPAEGEPEEDILPGQPRGPQARGDANRIVVGHLGEVPRTRK